MKSAASWYRPPVGTFTLLLCGLKGEASSSVNPVICTKPFEKPFSEDIVEASFVSQVSLEGPAKYIFITKEGI